MSTPYPTTLPKNFTDITHQKFGWLTVLSFVESRKHSQTYWLCKCQCGNEKTIGAMHLKSGRIKSCGCYRKTYRRSYTTHGMSRTSIYHIWKNMIRRCHNDKDQNYPSYGERGIIVCQPWHTFQNFFNDVGHPPFEGATLDRRDNNQGYSPDNVRWATIEQQGNNKRSNKLFTYRDETLTMIQWARKIHMNKQTFASRIRSGWGIQKIITTPVRKKRR